MRVFNLKRFIDSICEIVVYVVLVYGLAYVGLQMVLEVLR